MGNVVTTLREDRQRFGAPQDRAVIFVDEVGQFRCFGVG